MSYTLLMRREASCIHPGNENIQNCLTGTCCIPAAGVRSLVSRRNPIYHNYMDACLYWSCVNQAELTVSCRSSWASSRHQLRDVCSALAPRRAAARVSRWCIFLRAVTGLVHMEPHQTAVAVNFLSFGCYKLVLHLLFGAIKNVLNT